MSTAPLEGGVYRVGAPAPVGCPETLLESCARGADGGPAVVGFDFPIGIPLAYANRASIGGFLD
jgi:hypothetical protein